MKPFDPEYFRRTGGARMLELVTLYRQVASGRLTYLDSGVFGIDLILDSGERCDIFDIGDRYGGVFHAGFDYKSETDVADGKTTLDLVASMSLYYITILKNAYIREGTMAINSSVASELNKFFSGIEQCSRYARRMAKNALHGNPIARNTDYEGRWARSRPIHPYRRTKRRPNHAKFAGTSQHYYDSGGSKSRPNHAEAEIWKRIKIFRSEYLRNLRIILEANKPKREGCFLGDSQFYDEVYAVFEGMRALKGIDSNEYNTDVRLLTDAVYAAVKSREDVAVITNNISHFSTLLKSVLEVKGDKWGMRREQVRLYYICPFVHEDGSFDFRELRYLTGSGHIAKMNNMMSPTVRTDVLPLIMGDIPGSFR